MRYIEAEITLPALDSHRAIQVPNTFVQLMGSCESEGFVFQGLRRHRYFDGKMSAHVGTVGHVSTPLLPRPHLIHTTTMLFATPQQQRFITISDLFNL